MCVCCVGIGLEERARDYRWWDLCHNMALLSAKLHLYNVDDGEDAYRNTLFCAYRTFSPQATITTTTSDRFFSSATFPPSSWSEANVMFCVTRRAAKIVLFLVAMVSCKDRYDNYAPLLVRLLIHKYSFLLLSAVCIYFIITYIKGAPSTPS